MDVTGKKIATGGAALLAACYIGSYAWDKLSHPEAKAAQNELKEFKKLIAAGVLDEQELLACLTRMVREGNPAGKREYMNNLHLFVSLCAGKKGFKYPVAVVSSALDMIRSICRLGDVATQALCATGGVRVLFVALTRAYTECMSGGENASAAKDLVEKLLGVIDEVVGFDESKVVLPFDVPKEAAAAHQLADLKALSSITMLLRPEHGFAHKRAKVLGIISSVTALKSGAQRIMAPSADEANSCIDQLLYFAAKSDTRSTDYGRATMCIRNLVRHVPAARQRVLSTEAGIAGLANLPRLRDQFIEIVDGGAIGYPPRTQSGPPRETNAVSAGLDALRFLLESSDSKELANAALVDSNQRGVLALLGIMARCENPTVREKVARMFKLLGEEAFMYAELMHSYTGSGDNAERWGTGFRVAQEMHAREMKDRDQQRQQQQRMQQFMMQQRMMAEGGASPEEMMAMMGGGGMGGGMDEEMMARMMMAGGR
eukprot:TRINITY_DN16808_c1_g3_i1.p1 TRINITY_DN16808_c1_g3~~TRINITY_DN16808_c1_g3_i1.p1  ORF type:complete len:487 (+),score=213.11 TRINITY_DN16808_c1_g3_i1:41-1501(+)